MTNVLFQIFSLLLQVPALVIFLVIILLNSGVLQFRDMPWIIVTLVHLSLLPLLYGAFVYKTKRISDSEIMTRQERVLPFFIITFIYGVYLLETIFLHAPIIFNTLAIHCFILALLLSTITIFWKVSVHTAGITQFVALLAILIGSQALILSPLIVLTGWLRIHMKSHDIWQVLGGIMVALMSILVATQISPP